MENKKTITIPNILSIIRILILPFIVWLYLIHNYKLSFILLILSGLSDVVDGFIARKFNQVSDLGKVLDPIADKLTQVCVVLALAIGNMQNVAIWVLLIILVAKEFATLIMAVYLLNNGTKAVSAKWWGKVSTVLLYITMLFIVISKYKIFVYSDIYITVLASLSAIALIVSITGYAKLFVINPKKEKKGKDTNENDIKEKV